VFNLISDKKIIVVCSDKMAAIFLVCLGQFVEMFRLLQFCELKERKLRFEIVNSATFVATADSGDGTTGIFGIRFLCDIFKSSRSGSDLFRLAI
jgi:hypothetical protein